MSASTCPLCRRRRARRTCPALQREICTVCCATKRLAEIRCPSDCRYLASAQSHPPAAVQRQQERDVRFLLPIVAELQPHQYKLFFFVQNLLHGIAGSGDVPLDDRTVRETAEALAKTYDTASKGIIYEHQTTSPFAGRLSRELRPLLDDPAAVGGPKAGERDLAEVLRRIERAAAGAESALGGGGRAYLDLVSRMVRASPPPAGAAESGPGSEADDEPLVIVP